MNRFILVIFISLFLLPKVTLAHIETIQIKMSENGFEPAELSIHQNSQVEFVNTDQTPKWSASDVHPIHSIYPEFDPKKAIGVGKSWKFQFKRVGVWKYHDHLKPHLKGKIVVTQEDDVLGAQKKDPLSLIWDKIRSFVTKLKSIFTTQKNDFSSEKQFTDLKKLASIKGADQAWKFIKEAYRGEGGTSGNIHDLAHLSGSLIYEQKGMEGLSLCSSEFAFGCYHGFLDSVFRDSLDQLQSAWKGCSKLGTGGPFSSCIHGIGHGIASFHKTSDLQNSLTACDRLSSGSQFCHDGVFMEFARNASANFYKAENPLHPCDSVDQRYLFSCGRNQPNVLMQRFNFSFEGVSNLCLNAQNQDFKSACFDSLGFIAVASGKGDTITIEGNCNKIEDEDFRVRCLTAAAGELIFQDVSGWKESSVKLCQSLINESQKSCFEYIEQIRKDYGRI